MKLSEKLENFVRSKIPAIMQAQLEVANKMASEIRANAPVRTGKYASSIKVSEPTFNGVRFQTDIYSNDIVTDLKGKSYPVGALLEYGTSAHEIVPVLAEYLVFEKNGKLIRTKHVNHPGTVAQPHWQPALWHNEQEYKAKIEEAMK